MAKKREQRAPQTKAELDRGIVQMSPRIPVVGIGASAGGVNALKAFFEGLPSDTGAAFIVIVHLDPTTRSELPEILAACSKMPVEQVTTTSVLRKNSIYVIPPDKQLRISDDEIAAVPFDEPRGQRAPIDHFFRSLAEQHGDGFAVILTGAGSDGALGVKAVKAAGGIILVQDPSEAEYPSMPRSAIQTEATDFVLPVREMPERLVELIKTKLQVTSARQGDEDEHLRRVLAHLRMRTGHDFSHYKRSTIIRRLTRRMQVVRKETLEEYVAYLRESADEAQALLADLLISVTTFFRDPEAFDALARLAIPRLFEGKEAGGTIRVWVPGCATGEEAYSVAILLLEEASRHELRPEIQVFASDMDARALAFAREGRYPLTIEADLTEERLRRFFSREGDEYRVKRELRDIVLFANHSLLRDPPFSRLDLISCRNLLIYMDRDLQQQVLTTLHYGLNPTGYLFLGTSEGAEHPDGLFHVIDREARFYQSAGHMRDRFPNLPRYYPAGATPELALVQAPVKAVRIHAIHRQALESAAPPSIIVDDMMRALHLSETAGRYLQPSAGPLTADVSDLVRPELRFELRTALHRVFEHNVAVLSPATLVRFNGDARRVYMQVKPVADDQPGTPKNAIVFFIEGEVVAQDRAEAEPAADTDAPSETFRQLRQELELAQSRLRTTREESEAANEELRAANEELQSINEEYRSTAEELETSKEELQSINEELQTVNTELKIKLETVSRANSDLQNLMAATDFATLFLDPALWIKRFTPRLTELFSITPNDVGRPITDFTHQFDYEGIAADARQVLKELAPIEREIRSRQGDWYLLRFRPYRTVDDKIDGVVVTFVDVSQRKALEARQRLLMRELTHRVKNTLAVVQSIVQQTWRTSRDSADFVERLGGRITALANSHNLLVDAQWGGADLRGLVMGQLAPYAGEGSARLKIAGEPVVMPADVATALALVLHELATNAVKYGALSGDTGVVDLGWEVNRNGRAPTVKLSWREKNGPPVKPPATDGFGIRLIRTGVPGSKVSYEFPADGARFTIEFPIEERSEDASDS